MDAGCVATFTNVTFRRNQTETGGAMHVGGAAIVQLVNSIAWLDEAEMGPEIAVIGNSTVQVGYSDVDGGQAGAFVENGSTLDWGAGNINADPMFRDVNSDDYHLGFGSPCIDSGDNDAVPTGIVTDLDGNTRFVAGTE